MSFIKSFLNFLRLYKVGLKLAYAILIFFIVLVLAATRKSYLMETIFISSPFFTYLLNWKIVRYPIILLTYIFGASDSKAEDILSIQYPTAYYIILLVLFLICISLLIIKFVSPLIITPMFGVLAYLCRQTLVNYHKQDPIIYNGFFNWMRAFRILTPEEKTEIVTNYLNWKLQQNVTFEKIISLIEQEHYLKFTAFTTRQEIEHNVEQYLQILQAQQIDVATKLTNQGWTSYLPEIMITHPWLTVVAITICVTTLAVCWYLLVSTSQDPSNPTSIWTPKAQLDDEMNPLPTDARYIRGPRPGIWTYYSDYEAITKATPEERLAMADRMLEEPLRAAKDIPCSMTFSQHTIEGCHFEDTILHVRIKQPLPIENYYTVPPHLREMFDKKDWVDNSIYSRTYPDEFFEHPSVIYNFHRYNNPDFVDTSVMVNLGLFNGALQFFFDRVFDMTTAAKPSSSSVTEPAVTTTLSNGTDFELDSEGFGIIITLLIISARTMINIAVKE